MVAKSHRGLHLLGREERSLRVPIGVLEAAYGSNVLIQPPGAHYCVLRFEAFAADLLGLPVELAELTSGPVNHQILLTGYR